MTQLYIWRLERGVGDPLRTSMTDEIVEDITWTGFYFFEQQHHFFADADGNTPEIPEASVPEETQKQITELCNWLYSQPWGAVGGPLHIVTDDGNIEDSHLDYCLEVLDETPRYPDIHPTNKGEVEKCRQLLELLKGLTVGGRFLALEAAERSGGAY